MQTTTNTKNAAIIGAGLAGAEAAFYLASNGVNVKLIEMKPSKFSPAHKSNLFAELVCSNSFKASNIESASGLLKAECEMLNSLTVRVAKDPDICVSAGGALAVDREKFSAKITETLKSFENIEIITEEVTNFPTENTIIATGPLTSDKFADAIKNNLEKSLSAENNKDMLLNFFDASAPIISKDSIDFTKAFFGNRYGNYDDGNKDYINCPFTREEYDVFYEELIKAETAELHSFDKNPEIKVYEGCMPVEVLAKRGRDSIRFGCMKPVGLNCPDGRKNYAVVQLRAENDEKTMYNIVGFQTNLKFGEQKRVFSLIPSLENAEFLRYGVMHRNTYINSPLFLDNSFRLKGSDCIYFAGQITGTEGYIESAASGILSARALLAELRGEKREPFPKTTMLGAISDYIANYNGKDFQPMGANMGILNPLPESVLRENGKYIKDKKIRYSKYAERSLADLRIFLDSN